MAFTIRVPRSLPAELMRNYDHAKSPLCEHTPCKDTYRVRKLLIERLIVKPVWLRRYLHKLEGDKMDSMTLPCTKGLTGHVGLHFPSARANAEN